MKSGDSSVYIIRPSHKYLIKCGCGGVTPVDSYDDYSIECKFCGKRIEWHNSYSRYTITGILRDGRRFTPINTNTPRHYNIWCGTIWENLPALPNQRCKRRVVQKIFN